MSDKEEKKVDSEENEQKDDKPEINRIKTVNLTVDKEHPKDVYSWFEVTLQDVSVPNQMFQISVEIHLFWQDFTIPALLGKDWKKDAFEVNFDDCPVKMTEVFENKLSHAFENEPKFEYLAETGTIYMRWTSVATFQERLELERFPLDRQFLNMKFNAWVSKGNWNWITAYPDWVPKEFHKPFAVRCTSSVTEYDLLSPWVDFTGDTPLDIRLRVERKPEYYFANIILPNFLIVAGCFSTFVIKPSEVGDRLAITVTLMLAAVAFRFVVSTMLPKVSYLTWMDYYVLVGFIGLVLFIAENAIVGAPGFSEDAKKYIDLVSGVAFAIVWTIMHVVTLLILINKSWGRIPWNVMDELDRAEDADDEFVYAGAEDIKTNKPDDRNKELWSKYKALSPKDRANLYEKDRKEFLTVPSISGVVASVDDSNKNSDQDNKAIERVGTFSASSKGGLETNMVNAIELGEKKEVAIVEVSETDKDKETQL